jgi:hypothetical protein
MLDDLDRARSESAYLMGHKRDAYNFLTLHGDRLARSLYAVPLDRPAEALFQLTRIPGLGIVKAGFVCQLMGFDVACLDSRNNTRDGRNQRAYRSDGEARKSTPAFRRKIDCYLGETQGRAREYWDGWCTYVAPFHKLEPDEVSALHLAIVPDNFIPF